MYTETINTLNDFSKLFQRIKRGELCADVDVSQYTFFNPKEILMLTQFFVVQNCHDVNAGLLIGEENGWYLEAIHITEFCNTNYKNPVHQKRSISTAIPIRRISVSTMNAYINDALNFFSQYCRGKDTTILDLGISEIINNVNDHARSAYGAYIFSQYYKATNQIKFAISDLGMGIPRTVNDFLQSQNQTLLSNIDALKWAVQLGKTTKSQSYNKGFGLDNIISNLREIGTLEIYSNDVCCQLRKNGNLRFCSNPIADFIGTLIEVNVDINDLELLDETILEDFSF